ncbi:cytochrome P450 [Flagelloscypha sp. PMI_526]|nr:cytochrome P450 [Flagelloscypha sp. PMI_526]
MFLRTFQYLALGFGAVWLVTRIYHVYFTLTDIPTVGPSGFFTTFLAMKRYLMSPEEFLEEGYRKFPNMAFKLYTQNGWLVVVSGDERLSDMRKVGSDVLSFGCSTADLIQIKFTLGKELHWDMHNTDYIKLVAATGLTRSIADKFDEIREEVNEAIEDRIPANDDWVPVTALPAIEKIVSRASNRMLLGSKFCSPLFRKHIRSVHTTPAPAKDPEYLQLTTSFAENVVRGCIILHIFPEIFRPVVAKIVCGTESYYRKAHRYLGPLINYRLKQEANFGRKWEGKPNDCISWFLGVLPDEQRSVRDVIRRVLAMSFASLHTTSQSLSQALFGLAANPQYAPLLREEIEAVVERHGWSYASVQKMKRLDSFIKESLRFWGISMITSVRRVQQPFTFSNGQTIPPGFEICVPSKAVHLDESNHENAREFHPFRFCNMDLDSIEEGSEGDTRPFVATSKSFMLFGAPGRHNCPGRFIAATEIKSVLAYLIMNYDMKFENGERPKNLAFGPANAASETAQVLFRKRKF